MWECETRIEIEAPLESVYDRLADLGRHAEFAGGLAEVRQESPGPVSVGTRYRAQEVVPGRYVSHSEIINLHRKRHVPAENRQTLERIKTVLEAERSADRKEATA